MDDLLADAEDAFFEGNIPKAITLCEQVLAEDPTETDAYELLTLCLFESKPPQYEKALIVAQEWGKKCGEKPKQLKMVLRSSYHFGNPSELARVSKALSRDEEVLARALAAALASDVGELQIAMEIANNCAKVITEHEELKEEQAGFVRTQSLLAWVYLRSGDSQKSQQGLQILQELVDSAVVSEEIEVFKTGLGIAFALLVVHYLESGDHQTATLILDQASQKGFSRDENIQGAKALHTVTVSGKITPEALESANFAALRSTALLKKRVEEKILYSQGK